VQKSLEQLKAEIKVWADALTELSGIELPRSIKAATDGNWAEGLIIFAGHQFERAPVGILKVGRTRLISVTRANDLLVALEKELILSVCSVRFNPVAFLWDRYQDRLAWVASHIGAILIGLAPVIVESVRQMQNEVTQSYWDLLMAFLHGTEEEARNAYTRYETALDKVWNRYAEFFEKLTVELLEATLKDTVGGAAFAAAAKPVMLLSAFAAKLSFTAAYKQAPRKAWRRRKRAR